MGTIFQKISLVITAVGIFSLNATPVDDIGALSVVGKEIKGNNGQVV